MIHTRAIRINCGQKMAMKRRSATTDRAQFWVFENSLNAADSPTVMHGKYRNVGFSKVTWPERGRLRRLNFHSDGPSKNHSAPAEKAK